MQSWENITAKLMATGCSSAAMYVLFENMVAEIKKRTGWDSIDHVELIGNYSSGRNCTARPGDSTFSYYFRTYPDGRMMKFEER